MNLNTPLTSLLTIITGASSTQGLNPIHYYGGGFRKDKKLESYGQWARNRRYRKNGITSVKSNKKIEKWLSSREIEALLKDKKGKKAENRDFDPYYWTEDKGRTWRDMYPFVRPDVGWWMTKKIADYTVRVSYQLLDREVPIGVFGTGWFLDFELPEEDKYPTKWYMVTNAHVVNSMRFGRKSYTKNIPKLCTVTKRKPDKCVNNKTMFLSKDAMMDGDYMTHDKDPERLWGVDARKPNFHNPVKNFFVYADDDKVYKSSDSENKHLIYFSYVNKFNLVYFASNFMSDSKHEVKNTDYALDMAILEVDFENERMARRMTNDLYDKYYNPKKAYGVPLNFLSSKAGNKFFKRMDDEDRKGTDPYFSAGYPSNSHSSSRLVGNYSSVTRTASTGLLSVHSSVKHVKENKRVYTSGWKLEWGDKSWGFDSRTHFYILDNFRSYVGSSGSMVVDIDGNVLGLVTMIKPSLKWVLVTPLRDTKSEGVTGVRKVFDLITGALPEDSSYKKVVLDKVLNTYLRKTNKWGPLNSAYPLAYLKQQ